MFSPPRPSFIPKRAKREMKILLIIVLIWIHHKGWCQKLHRKPEQLRLLEAWQGECPLIDKVMLWLYPIKKPKEK